VGVTSAVVSAVAVASSSARRAIVMTVLDPLCRIDTLADGISV
jgi:hypothetical protein